MRIDAPIITGSFSLNGDTFQDLGAYTTTGSNTFIGNQIIEGTISASELSGSIDYTNLRNVPTLVSGSSQIVNILSSLNTYTGSNDTINTNQNNRLGSLENKTGSLATTGSNSFFGTQTFSGSVFIANDLVVQGSSSIQYISASSVSIGTNIVQLNTATPSVRYAGLSVQDSGSSAGVTGSMLWDSLCNRWIYSNPSGVGYSGGMLLSGPRTQTLGTEPTLTCNYIAKSGGGDHLYDSCIIDDGTTTCIKNNLVGTGTACFGSDLILVATTGNIYGGTSAGSMIISNIGGQTYARFYGASHATTPNTISFINASGTSLTINASNNVGVGITPVDKLHVNGNIISEGCFFSGAPDTLRIFAGHWSTVSGNSNCYLVFQGGGGSTSFGTPSGWGGSASIYTLGQNRLSINCTGVACFSNTICAASTYLGGCASVGGTTYDFGFEVFSTKQVAITSNNTFSTHLNLIFNRDNTGGTRKCFNILTDQNAAYLRALGSFPIIITTNNTCGDLGIANCNGYGWLYGQDVNHSMIFRGNRQGVAGDYTSYYQYGGDLSTGKGHLFYTGGELASQTLKMQIANNGIQVSVNFAPSANNTYCLGTSSCAWAHIYTNDLHLSNEGKCGGNDVDGTNGNWTIQEGAENLYIINNKNNKKFKIQLQEII
jgi:hypothetical protein